MNRIVRPSVLLEQLMVSTGLTVGELSALSGLSYERTRRLLRTGGDPRLSEAFGIARLVDTKVDELFVLDELTRTHGSTTPRRQLPPHGCR